MQRLITLSIFIVIVALLSSCSSDYKTKFQGVWEADQASQAEGSDDIIIHFNYLKVSTSDIIMKQYYLNGNSEKVFEEVEKSVSYEWESKNQILIDNQPYEIELKKKDLVIKNNNVEVHYKKSK